jgi:protein-S-isoprenylcysteine O-methyltransferase Ste14
VTIRAWAGVSRGPAGMLRGPDDPRDPTAMRREDLAYLPLVIVLALPVLACVLLMLIEPGINRSLFFSAIKTGIILVVVGGALCFVASRLAARSDS